MIIFLMLLCLILVLLSGYPVAFALSAAALIFGGIFLGWDFFMLLPLKIWGIMTNMTLIAVPLFIFMGVILERSGLAEDLLETSGLLLGKLRGGLAIAVVLVGALLSATTGVVGATVVTMGLIALPTMLKHGYSPQLASGTIAATGTLGQIIPPSIILILLGDVMGVPIGRLFMGAVVPGSILVGLFLLYILIRTTYQPDCAPILRKEIDSVTLIKQTLLAFVPLLSLVLLVLGTIFLGVASPTEAAAVGAFSALALAFCKRRLGLEKLLMAMRQTTRLTSMVFMILIGATAFGLVFRGLGGDQAIFNLLGDLPGGKWGFLGVSMLVIFSLGFFLDFLQICFIVVPIIAPIAATLGIDLLWLAVLIGVNLQTSFLTPPFGFSLFYLKASAPGTLDNKDLYKGVVPFIIIQVFAIGLIIMFPSLVSWLPDFMDRIHGL